MMDRDCEPHIRGMRHLTPSQWTAMKRSVIRRIHAERGRMMRLVAVAAVAALWEGWRRLCERQRARSELCAMSDYELHDMALSRTYIDAATRKGRDDDASAGRNVDIETVEGDAVVKPGHDNREEGRCSA
jgi:uncharacterized protein YjiS (DUF1127 family)